MQNVTIIISFSRHMSHQSALYEEHFRSLNGRDRMNEPDLPSIVTNISLLLLNSNLAVSNARAYVPNVVSVGGLHVNPGKLPDVIIFKSNLLYYHYTS